jgi:hypothetical protein
MHQTPNLDCEEGRRLGCQTFCCRLLVRLDPDEQGPAKGGQMPKRFVDKDAEGYCVNLDRESHRCRVWAQRPRACREYDCNRDFLLQVALRRRFGTIVELVTAAAKEYVSKESYIHVPHRSS